MSRLGPLLALLLLSTACVVPQAAPPAHLPPAPPPDPATPLARAAIAHAHATSSARARRAAAAQTFLRATTQLHTARLASIPPPPWGCTPAERAALTDLTDDARAAALAQSDADATHEWRTSPWVRRRAGPGLAYYRRMRWMYLRRGVCHPDLLFEQGIHIIRFFGRTLQVHAALVPRLAQVEARWRDLGHPRSPIIRAGGFKSRTVRGPYGTLPWLSNHAFGLAVDLDPHRNPYVSLRDLELIALISGVPITREATLPAAQRWDNFKAAEDAFRLAIGPWLRDNAAQLTTLRRAARSGDPQALTHLREAEALRRTVTSSPYLRALAHRKSLLHLPRDLVILMEDAGLTWCTDFTNGADLMHFELRR